MIKKKFRKKRDEPWWGLGKTSNKFPHIKKSHMILIFHEKKLTTIEMLTKKITHAKKMEKV